MGKETTNIAGKPSVIKRILRNPISGPYIALILLFIISSSAVCGAWTEESGFRKRIIKRAIKGVVS